MSKSRAVVTLLADVEPLPVDWLWPSRVPLGMLTVLDGDPGLGKSTVMLDLGARLSRGDAMPDGSPGPAAAGVVIMSAEDDLARVIRPRLEAAGADLQRIATVAVRGERGELSEPTICRADLEGVEQAITEVGALLVIVDPLMAFLPPNVNAHRDQDVRRALRELSALAERTGAAVVVIRHLNKSQGGPVLYRGGGSIGIIGAARAGLVLATDPDDASGEYRVLAMNKSNLAPPAPALRLRLVVDEGATFPRVSWQGESNHTATSLLAFVGDPEEQTALEDACTFLREILADGPVPAKDMSREARNAGISLPTLRRAKSSLQVESIRVGRPGEPGGHWAWRLRPGTHVLTPKMLNPAEDEHLPPSGGYKPLREARDPEGAHEAQDEHLQMNNDSGSRPSGIDLELAALENCPDCGKRVLDWGGRLVCTGCRRTLVAPELEAGRGA